MNRNELEQARANIETQYNNLSNNAWVSQELKYLQGKYDALTELINKLSNEEAQNATSQSTTSKSKDSNVNK